MWKKHMILIAFWRWWKLFQHLSTNDNQANLCQENTDEHRLGLESARAALCKWATRTHETCLSKSFAISPNKQKQYETLQKRVLVMIKHYLGISEINSIPEWRVFVLNKRKSLRVQQARADNIHSNREIKEIFDPEKLTFSINSGHKNA